MIEIIIDNCNALGNVLLRIINASLGTGIFLENRKKSIITPIEKVIKARKCKEFRPINTLKVCKKSNGEDSQDTT